GLVPLLNGTLIFISQYSSRHTAVRLVTDRLSTGPNMVSYRYAWRIRVHDRRAGAGRRDHRAQCPRVPRAGPAALARCPGTYRVLRIRPSQSAADHQPIAGPRDETQR